MANVYLHFDRSLLEGYCPIIMYSYDFERSDVRWLVFVCALVSHYYFIAWLVLMPNSCAILSAVIFIDYLLFSYCMNDAPTYFLFPLVDYMYSSTRKSGLQRV